MLMLKRRPHHARNRSPLASGLVGFAIALNLLALSAAPSEAQDLEIASTNESGQIVSGVAAAQSFISGNGRYVVFLARNLMAAAGTAEQVYLRDLWTNDLELVSVNTSGGGTTGLVDLPSETSARVISNDGRFVAFRSSGDDLVSGLDPGSTTHVFLRDRTLGTTTLISKASDGTPGNSSSSYFTVAPRGTSFDSAVVVFNSNASNLDALDPTGDTDTFHHDTLLGTTRLACFDLSGETIPGGCGAGFSVADGGAAIAIRSNHNNLVAGDTALSDIFVGLPFLGDAWEIMTADTFGAQTFGAAHSYPSISAEGHRVAFATTTSIFPTTDPPNTEDFFVIELPSGVVYPLTEGGPVSPVFRSIPSIAPGGGWIAIDTTTIFDPLDTGGQRDIYVVDFTGPLPGGFELISQNQGMHANAAAVSGVVSDLGDVAFVSTANNLAPIADTNSNPDVFVSLPEPGLTSSIAIAIMAGLCCLRDRRPRDAGLSASL